MFWNKIRSHSIVKLKIMKTKIYSALAVTFLSLILFSCKSVNKLYQKGDYDEAVLTAVKKIQKDKLTEETKEVMADAYAKAVNQRRDNIHGLEMRSDELKWEAIAYEYDKMQKLTDAINRSAEALQYVKPVDFRQDYANAADQAATVRQNRGLRLMQYSDKQSAKNAYHEFIVALQYRPGNSELEQLRDESYNNGATFVVVHPVSTRSYNYTFTNMAQDLDRQVLNSLQYNANEFVRYFTPYEAEQKNIRVDQEISFEFADLVQQPSRIDRTEREVSKEVVVRERRIRPDSVVYEYGRVYGKLLTTRETVNTTGIMYVTVRDANNNYTVLDRRVEGTHCYVVERTTFRGDERALSAQDRTQLNNVSGNRPSEWELMNTISRELQNNANNELRYFYSRY